MRRLFVGMGLAVAACTPAPPRPDAPPAERMIMTVETEAGGACSNISVQAPGGRSLAVSHACHGWTATSCGDGVLLRSGGVRIDRARLARSDAVADLDAVVVAAVAQRRPGHVLFNLAFANPVCGPVDVVAFTGATTPPEGGPATAFSGEVSLGRGTAPQITFDET